MKSGYYFRHQYSQNGPKVIVQLHEMVDIHEVMDAFEDYLLAIGFQPDTVASGSLTKAAQNEDKKDE